VFALDARRRARLRREGVNELWTSQRFTAQEFECDVLAELEVHRGEHLTRGACSHALNDSVLAREHLSGKHRQIEQSIARHRLLGGIRRVISRTQ
jgi:hypothetical protein